MKSTRVDEDGNVRCPKCGAANSFTSKRTGKGKALGSVFGGVGILAAPKRLQCQGCGTYLRSGARPAPRLKSASRLTPERAAEKCRHGVRRDICALCGYTKRVPGA